MSFKASLIRAVVKLMPKTPILWVANRKLRGIAEVKDFSFDLETRKAYVQTKLFGEAEAIEIWVEKFAVVSDEGSYKFIVQQAQSNRPWLNNVLSRMVGKAWKIPEIPRLAAHMGLVSELLKA